jgi:hypothetical protein
VSERIRRLEEPRDYEVLGITSEARALYARLAAAGALPADEPDVAALEVLLETGLAILADGSVSAVPPAGPLVDLAARHMQQVVASQHAMTDLMTIWRSAAGQEVGIEIVSGVAARRRAADALGNSVREVMALAIGPRAGMTIEQDPGLEAALQRGVRVRVVYHSRLFENESALAVAASSVAAGEEARVFPGVPVNMVIMDDFATMNVSYNSDEPIHLACVHNRRVIESWKAIFESYWQLGLPLDPRKTVRPGAEEHRELVRLLSLGITDRAIAHELGVSERTVGRRITALQEQLGADTRFQLGLQIAMQGWI